MPRDGSKCSNRTGCLVAWTKWSKVPDAAHSSTVKPRERDEAKRERALTRRDEFGCEVWQGARTADGYGLIGSRVAHRVLWERVRGPIPEGKALDHLCRRRSCVALHHLEVVSASDNERRKSWRVRVRARHCAAGHDMAVNAVVTPWGGRVCRECNRLAMSR
jgi:hypothetical protein